MRTAHGRPGEVRSRRCAGVGEILRTDAAAHRRLPADIELVAGGRAAGAAGQDATWYRQQVNNQLRSLLREYFPAPLEGFAGTKAGLAVRRLARSWPQRRLRRWPPNDQGRSYAGC
jgi:hypothetical protein